MEVPKLLPHGSIAARTLAAVGYAPPEVKAARLKLCETCSDRVPGFPVRCKQFRCPCPLSHIAARASSTCPRGIWK